MPKHTVFHWRDGRGWLVFSGGSAIGDIRATAIERMAADGGIAYISLDDQAEAALDDMQELGAPSGYLVDVITESDDALRTQIGEASMVVITGGESIADTRSVLYGTAIEAMQAAYENGAVILVEGAAVAIFGAYFVANDDVLDGFDWLHRAYVTAPDHIISHQPEAQIIADIHKDTILVGIDESAALVFGPDGQLETWGNRQITITLGSAYTNVIDS